MVAAIGVVGALGSMGSIGALGLAARGGRPLAVGAAATTGNQMPVRKVPKQAPAPMPSTVVNISEDGRRALAVAHARVDSKPSFVATEMAALARANRVAPAEVGVAGSVSNLGAGESSPLVGNSEVGLSDQALMSLILALLAEVRSSENAAAATQAHLLSASQ
jgi:hypothetical protein